MCVREKEMGVYYEKRGNVSYERERGGERLFLYVGVGNLCSI